MINFLIGVGAGLVLSGIGLIAFIEYSERKMEKRNDDRT